MVDQTLEDELAMLLGIARLSARQARAAAVRLGWDGCGGATLQEAATVEGYTGERVRQLEARLQRILAAHRSHGVRIREATEIVERAAPDSRDHIATLLLEAGLTRSPFDPAGVVSAAGMVGLDCRVAIRRGLVLPDDDRAADIRAVRLARRLARHDGVVGVDRLAAEARLEPDQLRRLLRDHPKMSWLGRDREWLRPGETGRPIARLVAKMLVFSDPLSLDDIRDGLSRANEPAVGSPDALLTFCESCSWLRVDRDRQTVSNAIEMRGEAALSPVERRLATIFRASGPILTARQAIELGVRNGLNAHTVGVYLARSPILRRSGRGRYALLGHDGRSLAFGVA